WHWTAIRRLTLASRAGPTPPSGTQSMLAKTRPPAIAPAPAAKAHRARAVRPPAGSNRTNFRLSESRTAGRARARLVAVAHGRPRYFLRYRHPVRCRAVRALPRLRAVHDHRALAAGC